MIKIICLIRDIHLYFDSYRNVKDDAMNTIGSTSRIFKALSEPNRLRILKMLQVRNLCVCEITEILGLATSTVSNHLSILADAGFIIEEKDGRWVNYRINPHPNDPVAGALGSLLYGLLNDLNEIASDRRHVGVVDRITICR